MLMTTKRLITMALAGLGVLAPAAADAACSINTTAVNFATYNVFSATPDDGTGQIRFRCTGSPPPLVTIHLDKGGAPSFTPREMRRGSEVLGYNLYLDSTRTTIWGDGTGGSQAFIQSSPPLNVNIDLNVFGRIPPGQDVSAGIYFSIVTATIFF
jgi:spore coat protein U-like protein